MVQLSFCEFSKVEGLSFFIIESKENLKQAETLDHKNRLVSIFYLVWKLNDVTLSWQSRFGKNLTGGVLDLTLLVWDLVNFGQDIGSFSENIPRYK